MHSTSEISNFFNTYSLLQVQALQTHAIFLFSYRLQVQFL